MFVTFLDVSKSSNGSSFGDGIRSGSVLDVNAAPWNCKRSRPGLFCDPSY